jgi:hypothetical protein
MSMTEKLLARVYAFIKEHNETTGDSPSLRDIADGCHLTLGSVLEAVSVLESRVWIERVSEGHRAVGIHSHAAD